MKINELIKYNPVARKYYYSKDFFWFCRNYFREYFTFTTPECLIKIYDALEEWKNVFIEWFRWCAKTTITQMYVAWCIANKFRRNIMWYSQTIDNATENLTYIANSFIWDTESWWRFVRDYWNLYYPETIIKQGQKKMKRVDKFVTENECYVRAMSLWTSPRWKNFTASDWKFRPDLLVFDDVDTIASCQSKKKIDKNFEFLLNEVLWWTTSATQMIFLWNTIYEDWLVPRFREHIKNDKNWLSIRIPIYDNDKIVWDRFVATDEEALKLNVWIKESNKKYTSLETEKRRLWTISFNQNYMLIPYVLGQHIITRDMIQYDSNCLSYTFDRTVIWVDPAISTKEWADNFAISVVWYLWERRYVLECVALNGKDKDIWRATSVVKSLYQKWNANLVAVETVAYQAVLKTVFQNMWLAVEEIKTSKDKRTRLMEKQILFENHRVYFYPKTTEELVDELLIFPNWEHDDRIDSLLFALKDLPDINIYFI